MFLLLLRPSEGVQEALPHVWPQGFECARHGRVYPCLYCHMFDRLFHVIWSVRAVKTHDTGRRCWLQGWKFWNANKKRMEVPYLALSERVCVFSQQGELATHTLSYRKADITTLFWTYTFYLTHRHFICQILACFSLNASSSALNIPVDVLTMWDPSAALDPSAILPAEVAAQQVQLMASVVITLLSEPFCKYCTYSHLSLCKLVLSSCTFKTLIKF